MLFFIMMRDRIIVGEVRGPEAIDMLMAMNTGHDGSLSTGHANSPKDMLSRIETMISMGIFGMLRCFLILLPVCLMGAILWRTRLPLIEKERISRPAYGEGSRQEELVVEAAGEQEKVTFAVSDRKYSRKQAKKLLEKALEEWKEKVPGKGRKAEKIRGDLELPETLQQGAVKVEYLMIPYGILDSTGRICPDAQLSDHGTMVEIQTQLTCGEEKVLYDRSFRLFPTEKTKEEQFWETVRLELEDADSREKEKAYLTLPESVGKQKLTWRRFVQGKSVFFLLLLFLPVGLFLHHRQQVHEEAQRRSAQLMLDYPELMWKMSLLLGAGMTIRGAFERIASRQREDQRGSHQKRERYLLLEMQLTMRQMRSGKSEGSAYEEFGRRCGLPRYIKLGTILSQNLKKGSRGLAEQLAQEAASSMEERKNAARRIGERAGTKILMPMMLMLGVVLLVLTVPAFMGM